MKDNNFDIFIGMYKNFIEYNIDFLGKLQKECINMSVEEQKKLLESFDIDKLRKFEKQLYENLKLLGDY